MYDVSTHRMYLRGWGGGGASSCVLRGGGGD